MTFIYQDYPLNEREKMLSNLAVKKETRPYSRSLEQSEIDLEKNKIISSLHEKKILELELKNIKDDYNRRIALIQERIDETLVIEQNGKISITDVLYAIPNHANGRMLYYSKWGELVDSRNLLPQEMQGRLYVQEANGAFVDLPVETQKVVNEKLQEGGPAGVDAAAQKLVDEQVAKGGGTASFNDGNGNVVTVDTNPTFTHDEEGWEVMTDPQLIAKYGTTDISVIRTMELHTDGTYKVPTEPVVDKAKKTRTTKKQ